MAQIYCRKTDDFEFVVYPHYHDHVVVINTCKGIVCKPLFSIEAFNPPYFEVNVQNAYFQYKSRIYRIDETIQLEVIPDWFNVWYQAGRNVKLRLNAEDAFVLNGIKTKRETYYKHIGLYP